jgi:uncharacterized protein (DUF736 family)
MADYDNTNRGAMFVEQDKKSDKGPDYSGTLNVEGKEYRIAGWKRESKGGKRFISISLSEPRQQGASGSQSRASGNDGW